MTFFHALADPSQTSALHDALATVLLGDAYGGDGFPDCERGHDGVFLSVGLGEGMPTTVSYADYLPPLNVPAQTSVTPDRTELDITVQSPLFANMNLICWEVTAANPADTSDQDGFWSGFRLMDGFTPQDGDLAYVGSEDLESEARWVNNNLGRVKNPVFFSGTAFQCRRDGFGGVRCGGARRMPSIVGKPTLSIQRHPVLHYPQGAGRRGGTRLASRRARHPRLAQMPGGASPPGAADRPPVPRDRPLDRHARALHVAATTR